MLRRDITRQSTCNGAYTAWRFTRWHCYRPQAVVMRPVRFDPDSDEPILPARRCVARMVIFEPITDQDDASRMNLIWLAEIDDEKSIKTFAEEALRQVDGKRQAEGFSF